ncbi:MAG: lipid-A-disaccharide synthase [Synergistota bacterium]|nr:lipid-A-disaccharide synthase [Synergistota bacterium]
MADSSLGPGDIFLSSGEASGDHYLAQLTGALRAEGFGGCIWGMAGDEAERAGVKKTWSNDALHLMGVSEVLPSIPRLIKLKNDITDHIVRMSPGAAVLADSPDFHIPLARALRMKGYAGKIFYIAPPTVWAWRKGRTRSLRAFFDLCFPLLGFEDKFLESSGVTSRWKGYPLLDEISPQPVIDFKQQKKPFSIGLFPGSRTGEVKRLGPVLRDVADGIAEMGNIPVISIAPSLPEAEKVWLTGLFTEYEVCSDPGKELLNRVDCAIGASGTLAMESLLRGKWMIVLYMASFSSWLAYRMAVKTPWISLPNVVAEEEIFPELLQRDVEAANILSLLQDFIKSPYRQRAAAKSMEKAVSRLGDNGAYRYWARSILEVADI